MFNRNRFRPCIRADRSSRFLFFSGFLTGFQFSCSTPRMCKFRCLANFLRFRKVVTYRGGYCTWNNLTIEVVCNYNFVSVLEDSRFPEWITWNWDDEHATSRHVSPKNKRCDKTYVESVQLMELEYRDRKSGN